MCVGKIGYTSFAQFKSVIVYTKKNQNGKKSLSRVKALARILSERLKTLKYSFCITIVKRKLYRNGKGGVSV